MREPAKYMKHKELGFVVKTEPGLGKIKFNEDWIVALPEEDLLIFAGKVVHDPNDIWGDDKESTQWGFTAFEASSRYQVDLFGSDNEYWEATDLETGDTFEGNIIRIQAAPGEKNEVIEIEWDSDLPGATETEEIETEINKLL